MTAPDAYALVQTIDTYAAVTPPGETVVLYRVSWWCVCGILGADTKACSATEI